MAYLDPTSNRVRDEVGLTAEDLGLDSGRFDTVFERILEREETRVEDLAGVAGLEVTEYTETLDGTGTDELALENRPVQELVDLTVDGVEVDVDDVFVFDTHLELHPAAAVSTFKPRPRAVEVTYRAGVPADHGETGDQIHPAAEGAIVRLTRHALERIDTDVLQQETVGNLSTSYKPASQVIAEERAALGTIRPAQYGAFEVI